jgi:hypothetical protein
MAQQIARGKFILSENTHFGKTLLPPGHYAFSVEPTASMQLVRSPFNMHRTVLVIIRPENRVGPMATAFAVTSEQSCTAENNGLFLVPEADGFVANSMCLQNPSIALTFNQLTASNKSKMPAQMPERSPTLSASKASD